MRFKRPIVSNLRLQRLHRWALLWLTWFAAFLDQAAAFAPFTRQATDAAHQWLDKIERLVIAIVLFRATAAIRLIGKPKHSSRRCNETQLRRAVVGSALRRALKRKSLRQRIAALSQNLDKLVARLVRRLPRGLTRRRPFIARPEPRVLALALAEAAIVLSDDTS